MSQRLIPKIGGGRLMINEIMGSNMRTRETLLLGEGDIRSFSDIIEASNTYGWRTFDQALIDAYSKELITEETAMIFSTSKSKVRQGIDHVKKAGGREGEGEPLITAEALGLVTSRGIDATGEGIVVRNPR